MLTVPSRPPPYDDSNNIYRSAKMFQLFFPCFSFGIVAIGTGVIKSSSLAFGSDQLKQEVYQENERAMERYFSWYYAVKSYYGLAAFCENMGEEIPPFLNPLMGKLISALQSSPRNLQETCMSAFGSVASAAEQAFLPYAERFLELMKVFMLLSNLQTILHEPVSQTFTFFHSIQLITYLDSAGKMHRVSKGDPKQVIQFDV